MAMTVVGNNTLVGIADMVEATWQGATWPVWIRRTLLLVVIVARTCWPNDTIRHVFNLLLGLVGHTQTIFFDHEIYFVIGTLLILIQKSLLMWLSLPFAAFENDFSPCIDPPALPDQVVDG